jgi:serine/threonine-protein kinase
VAGIRPGDVIAGKFRVERVLGEGGMGYVVSARHLQLGQIVALKFMREEICTPEYKSRFLREARNTVRLRSKHVSRVLDVGTLEGGVPYMVMEYLEGTDLSDLLHKQGPLPAQEVCEYVLQACEAIAEAHGYGIVHRDLKPANLFLTKGQSGEPIVKVLDFGVSKVLDDDADATNAGGRPRARPDTAVTKATDLLGSPSYMAPEQIMSSRDADARSDVWSLGVILFRLISGRAPFQATSLGELIQAIVHGPMPNLRDARPDVPSGLEHVVARCLERDKRARLGDVVELARLLAPYAGPVATPSLERIAVLGPSLVAAHRPTSLSFNPGGSGPQWAGPPSRGAPPPRAPGRSAVWAVAALALLLLIAVTVGVGVRRARRERVSPGVPSVVTPEPVPVSPVPVSVAASGALAPPPASAAPEAVPPRASASAHPRARPAPRGVAASSGDIPSTRE